MRRIEQAGYILLPVVFAGAAVAAIALYLTFSGGLGTATREAQIEAEQLRAVAEAGYSKTAWRSRVLDCAAYTGELASPFENHQFQSTVTPTTGTPMDITVTATHASGLVKTITRKGVTRFSVDRTETKTPNSVNGYDTSLNSDFPGANYGGKNTFGPTDNIRGLIRFDLSDLPADSVIYSATLTVHPNPSGANVIHAHQVTSEWQEGNCINQSCTPDGATWTNRVISPLPLPWGSPGGDFEATPVASGTTYVDVYPTVDLEITALTQDWVRGTVSNYGVMLLSGTPGVAFNLASSDNVDPGQWPSLTISYSCPCGAACDTVQYCNADYAATNAGPTFPTLLLGDDNIWGIEYLAPGITIMGQTTTGGGGLLLMDYATGNLHLADLDGTPRTFAKAPVALPRVVTFATSGPWAGSTIINDEAAKTIHRVLPDGSLADSFSYAWDTAHVLDIGFIDQTATGTYDGGLLAVTDVNWKGNQADPRLYVFDYAGTVLRSIDLDQLPPFLYNPQGVAHLPGTDKALVADKQGAVHIYDLETGALLTTYDSIAIGNNRTQGAAIRADTCEHILFDEGGGGPLATSRVRFLDAGP